MLAYHLLTWVRETLRLSGDPRDWNTQRIRKPSQPDAEQQHLYDNLGIDSKAAFPAIKTTTTP